jgi:drug/metabolite transporter (DMT)-like permease
LQTRLRVAGFRKDVAVSRRGTVLFLALSLMWGVPYLMIRVAVRHGVDPGTLVFLRTAPAAVILLPVAWRTGALKALRGRRWWVALYAPVHFGAPLFFIAAAEQHLTSSVTGMLIATVPIASMAVAKVTHPEDVFGRSRIVGLVLGAIGVGLLVGFEVKGSTWVWLLAMAVAVLGYTFGPVILSLRLTGVPGLGVIAAAVTLVALAYAPYGLTHLPAHAGWSVIGALAVLALVCTAGAFLVFFELVKEVGPARTVVVTYLNTAVAVILGVVVLSEPLTVGIIVGFPLIVAGSVLGTRRSAPVSEGSPTDGPQPRRSFFRAPTRALPR